ncbi:hypothetical protein B0H11DRAFT_1760514, partial [Mycena galericulata]
STDEIIIKVQQAVKLIMSQMPMAATIWRSIRHKDITHQIRTFLWKCLHGALEIGKFW